MKFPITKGMLILLAAVLIFVQFPMTNAIASGNEAVQINKKVNPIAIIEGGEAEVRLDVSGSGDVNFVKPNDIILIIDRSGSMVSGEDKMTNAKNAAKGFIDLVDFSKHRIGIVDFSSDVKYKGLSSDPNDLKNYINGIQAGGGTNTKSSIEKARELLSNHRTDAQPVILLLTDGEATEPTNPETARVKALEQAGLAKDEGIVFYTIALLKSNEDPETSAPNQLMKEMATTAHHHHFVLGSVGLTEIYKAIVDEIGVASAYDVSVTDTIGPEFEIVPDSYTHNIPQPVINGNTVTFKFNELKEETLTLTYKIRHKPGSRVGNLSVGGANINVTYKDYAGSQRQFTVAHPTINVKYPAPEITSIVENKGAIVGGENVIINGKNFLPNPSVLFGNTPATSVQYVDSTKLIVTTPKGTQGEVVVKVINTDSQYATASYRYIANPVVTSIQPNIGPLAGGTKVTIIGDYFLPGAIVKFGDLPGEVISVSPKQIVVTTPAVSAAGSVDVTIENPDGTFVVVPNGYSYVLAPEIISVTPAKGLTLGQEKINIKGNNFLSGAKVYFNNTLISSSVISGGIIEATTPTWAVAENVKITVVNPDGQETVLNPGYQYVYPAPSIVSVTPNQGEVTGNLMLDIRGEYFQNGAKVFFDNVELTGVIFYSGTQLKVRTPSWADQDIVDVKVVNPDAQAATVTDGFAYTLPAAPQLTEISPIEGPLSGGTSVKITGKNLGLVTNVYLDNANVPIKSNSGTDIIITTLKATTPGKVDIKVVDKYGRESILVKAFEYLAPPPPPLPTIVSVTPNESEMKGGITVIIKGTNFEGTSKVYINNIAAPTLFYSSKELRATVPASTVSGTVDVKVVNLSGEEAVAADAFTYLAPPPKAAPVISTVTPSEGALQGGYIVRILGSNFDSTAKLYFNDSIVQSTYYSSSEIRLTVPPAQVAGTVDVKVVNSDGQEFVATDAFTYLAPPPPPAPTITSVTPNEGKIDGGYYIIVKGSNFSSTSKIHIDNQPVSTLYYSTSELRGLVPASSIEKVVDVKVLNSDGQSAIAAGAFKYVAPPLPPGPTISSLSPNNGVLTGGYYSFINGENFNTTSKVYFNDSLVGSTFYSKTQLRVLVPANSATGPVTVKVINGDGQEAVMVNGFTYLAPPPPTVTQITPNNGEMIGGYYIVIKGSNFNSTSMVYINNVASQTLFYSTSEIRAKVPQASQPGIVDVRVVNSDGQEVTVSGGFTYNSPPLPPAPVITSITPNKGQMTGGYYIIIKGANFDSDTKVWLNNVQVNTLFYSINEVRGLVPASTTSGPIDVKVVNKDRQFAEAVGGFVYEEPPKKPAPTITSVTPNSGPLGGGSFISIKGTNFEGATKVYINDISVQTLFYSTGEVRARVPAGTVPEAVDIKVVNSDGQFVILEDGYTYN
ncbi:IPT/TIG domain-containing protein [Paenibacillus phoenicis]|uniref:IPT/TIG domain-containing protein n=1 Tax=Paenibacillus phoenicis TaxID=554117 RepID=UPI003D2D9D56